MDFHDQKNDSRNLNIKNISDAQNIRIDEEDFNF